eukprot:jgi/Bigna1/54784/estExt_Genewise1Plus.C_430031
MLRCCGVYSNAVSSSLGRETRKGVKGIASNYIHRTKAVRRLQVSLRDFRRLCILKGIYPRDPKKKPNGNDKTYYHIKDIKFLMHEPLLKKFREMKIFLRRHKKAMIKREFTKAKLLERSMKPRISLDHLVKERYPSFVDAVRDLDDPLSMIFLFALLPSQTCREHEAKISIDCQALSREFQHWVIQAKSLRKVFVSVKGVYYQARVYGQDVTWLVPHKFKQTTPKDVDFRVMVTFLQFYATLVRFINYKLYYDLGLRYPPVLEEHRDREGAYLSAMKLEEKRGDGEQEEDEEEDGEDGEMEEEEEEEEEGERAEMKKKMQAKEEEEEEEEAEEAAAAESEAAIETSILNAAKAAAAAPMTDTPASSLPGRPSNWEAEESICIFSGLKFLLGREVPHEVLEFVILAGGGEVFREGLASREQAMDESITHQIVDRPRQQLTLFTRQYAQPQWVFDSFNVRALLPIQYYQPGAKLPPHLSPFVDDEREGYIPRQREVLRSWGGKVGGAPPAPKEGEEADDAKREVDREDENEADATSTSLGDETSARKRGRDESAQKSGEDLAKIMMTNKTRRLYDRMKYGEARKEEKNEELRKKRQKLEKKSSSKTKKTAS